jgi:hypothetical protein
LSNAFEKEIEIILRDANNIINRQKEALEKAKGQNDLKDKIKELEDKHISDKKES